MNSFQILTGCDMEITTGFNLRHLKVKDVLEIGEGVFSITNALFCYKPFDMIEVLYKANIDYTTLSNYGLFNILFPIYYENIEIKNALNILLGLGKKEEIIQVQHGDGKYYYLNKEMSKIIIDEEAYVEIRDFLFIITKFKNKKEEKFANEFTKEMYIESLIEEKEIAMEENKNEGSSILGLITAMVLELNYRYEEVLDLYIYQFYSLIEKTIKRQEYKNLMTGIYSGSVDGKKINMNEHNWLID